MVVTYIRKQIIEEFDIIQENQISTPIYYNVFQNRYLRTLTYYKYISVQTIRYTNSL